ncbi:hypothetical protein [Pseudonocardia parietis]|uniref:Uncharacterized protein n=1 Tax=Pseudonocardia parietis TaxID=570936 RepID=A0ABS4VLB1_9PSEU|nr:hypothetical protein [Pseudonocardia parietis]MBP2364586.1 hypothetical protein [Pseudonocardia parietis]
MTEPSPYAADDDVLVTFMLDQPGLLDLILSQHVDDDGGYCLACPGPQSGRRRFPCDVRQAADRAARLRHAQALEHRRDGDGPLGL